MQLSNLTHSGFRSLTIKPSFKKLDQNICFHKLVFTNRKLDNCIYFLHAHTPGQVPWSGEGTCCLLGSDSFRRFASAFTGLVNVRWQVQAQSLQGQVHVLISICAATWNGDFSENQSNSLADQQWTLYSHNRNFQIHQRMPPVFLTSSLHYDVLLKV